MTLATSEPSSQSGRPGATGGESDLERAAGFASVDLTAIRNLLRGGSVIDWTRLAFTDESEVSQLLRGWSVTGVERSSLTMDGGRHEIRHLLIEGTKP